jgi:hypothetical protein
VKLGGKRFLCTTILTSICNRGTLLLRVVIVQVGRKETPMGKDRGSSGSSGSSQTGNSGSDERPDPTPTFWDSISNPASGFNPTGSDATKWDREHSDDKPVKD